MSAVARPGGRRNGKRSRDPKDQYGFGWKTGLFFVLLLVVNYTLADKLYNRVPTPRATLPYSPTFLKEVRSGNVVSLTARGQTVQGKLRRAVRYPPGSKAEPAYDFATLIPDFADKSALDSLLQRERVTVTAKPPESQTPLWAALLIGFGPTVLFVSVFVWAMRRFSSGAGVFSIGRSKARRYEASDESVTFQDVAGIDEAKAELEEIVDFLKEPEKYAALGARIPHGVLLSGAPGTGKTLLARAVAGEAQVPFFSMSASEFVEMVVGVGASRVRDLFAKAKAQAPAIIFIDEIDAIGRSRASGAVGGANDEREQTLNQILTEMDGFDPRVGVIVLAATNRPDVLDRALLRPGRFDRRIAIQLPDKQGRRAILAVHTRGVPLAPDVDLEALSQTTVGMVGADLANLVNEAALEAARQRHQRVEASDFADSLERILLGAERKVVMSDADRRRTAYHEAGHALVGMLSEGSDPVRKISIIPRGQALGVTLATPESDRFNYDRRYLEARLEVALAGRSAEELVFGDVTVGAANDLKQATALAKSMVGRWGMSEEVGLVAVLPEEGEPWPQPDGPSPQTLELVDREVKRLLDEAHRSARTLLETNRPRLDALAAALMREETLDEEAAYAAAGLPRDEEPPSSAPAGAAEGSGAA